MSTINRGGVPECVDAKPRTRATLLPGGMEFAMPVALAVVVGHALKLVVVLDAVTMHTNSCSAVSVACVVVASVAFVVAAVDDMEERCSDNAVQRSCRAPGSTGPVTSTLHITHESIFNEYQSIRVFRKMR